MVKEASSEVCFEQVTLFEEFEGIEFFGENEEAPQRSSRELAISMAATVQAALIKTVGFANAHAAVLVGILKVSIVIYLLFNSVSTLFMGWVLNRYLTKTVRACKKNGVIGAVVHFGKTGLNSFSKLVPIFFKKF